MSKNYKALRAYQSRGVDIGRDNILSGIRRLLFASPTGSGKTFMFCAIAAEAFSKGGRVLIMTDRKELLNQSSETLACFNLFPTKIKQNSHPNLDYGLSVGMSQTLKRRLKDKQEYRDYVKSLTIVIIDEAHIREPDFIFEYLDESTFVLGFTATPTRMGKDKPLKDFYYKLVEVEKISNLIRSGYLLPAKHYDIRGVDTASLRVSNGEYSSKSLSKAFGKKTVYTGVYQNYMKICPGTKFLCFCVSIENAQELKEDLCEKGLAVEVVDSKNTNNYQRELTLNRLKTGEITGVINVGILTTGFDEPTIETIILYRATKSVALYIQMIGRGSRLSPTTGKTHFNILDFGGNVERFGFYHDDRLWTLNPEEKEKQEGLMPVRTCPECGYMMHPSVRVCPECGEEFPITESEMVEAYLQEVPYQELVIKPVDTVAQIGFIEAIRVKKNFKQGWILNRFTTREQFEKYAKLRKYDLGWVDHQCSIYNIKE